MKIKLWTSQNMRQIKECIDMGAVITCDNKRREECDKHKRCKNASSYAYTRCKPCLVTIEWAKK